MKVWVQSLFFTTHCLHLFWEIKGESEMIFNVEWTRNLSVLWRGKDETSRKNLGDPCRKVLAVMPAGVRCPRAYRRDRSLLYSPQDRNSHWEICMWKRVAQGSIDVKRHTQCSRMLAYAATGHCVCVPSSCHFLVLPQDPLKSSSNYHSVTMIRLRCTAIFSASGPHDTHFPPIPSSMPGTSKPHSPPTKMLSTLVSNCVSL